MNRFSRGGSFIRFNWVESQVTRQHVISVKTGTAVVGGNNTVLPRDQVPQPLQAAVNFYMQQIDWAVGTGFRNATWELYTQADEDALPVLIQAGGYTDLQPLQTGEAGASGTTVLTISYRSETNGRGRIVLSGTSVGTNVRLPTSAGLVPDNLGLLYNYLASSACMVVAPDGGYPLAIRGATTKTNDQLLKRIRP